uniref:Membrane spanning protein n=1 Tax=Globodera pallida TaxID=36090 RepID=A0A183CDH9_GLOPA
MVEPNIPIYLILSGLFLILNGGARIFLGLSAASTKRPRQIRSEHRKSTTRPVLNYAVEGIGLFAILVLVILGSVWVYGASRYMHSQLYMFERHFCQHTLYWTAWWSVTIHLGVFALLILLGIVVLVYAAMPGGE